MKVVFMGTPDFAVVGLKAIHENSPHEVVGVVTVPDKPAGRGRKIQQSAVKTYAQASGLTLLQPPKLKNQEFLTELKNLNADCFVVIAFRMLPKEVWSMPPKGTFNLHASLLPAYRGAAPINHAIINGETKTGVTTFLIDEKIDTGAILLQESIDIYPDETAGELHDRLANLGASVTLKTLKGLAAGELTPKPQPKLTEKTAPKIFKNDCRIDWLMDGEKVHDFIRGLSPYPCSWTILEQNGQYLQVKIYKGQFKFERHMLETGKIIIQNQEILVAVEDGFYRVLKLQLEGRKAMNSKDLLNGFAFDESAKFT